MIKNNNNIILKILYIIVQLQSINLVFALEKEQLFMHLLQNLKNDILNLKPGSNKTYILNSKLLGRNDSIELDIKSRTKSHNNNIINNNNNNNNIIEHNTKISNIEHNFKNHKHIIENDKSKIIHEERKEKWRKNHMNELIKTKNEHKLKIKRIIKKHNDVNKNIKRRKIKIKVLRKNKINHQHDIELNKKNKSKSILLHGTSKLRHEILKRLKVHFLKLKKKHDRKRIRMANGKDDEYVYDDEYDDDSKLSANYGGGPGHCHGGILMNEYDSRTIEEMFEGTDVQKFEFTTTKPSTTPITTKDPKNNQDEYTYEYVYEDEIDKTKTTLNEPLIEKQHHEEQQGIEQHDKHTKTTDNEYTYEYVYEDEVSKVSTVEPVATTIPIKIEVTTDSNEVVVDDYDYTFTDQPTAEEEDEDKITTMSPSMEAHFRELALDKDNISYATYAEEELYGDSDSNYIEPPRFKNEYELPMEYHPTFTPEYDQFAPVPTTTAKLDLIAGSSIMYDDEDTQEFLAKRNQTKKERGWDSYPKEMIFTIDTREIQEYYTRPSITPEDYAGVDSEISMWNNKDKQFKERFNNNKSESTTKYNKYIITNSYNNTNNYNNNIYNITMKEYFDLIKHMQNTSLSINNITTVGPYHNEPNNVEHHEIIRFNKHFYPDYHQNIEKRNRRYKRDIGGGMKIPRSQYDVIMYLCKLANKTKYIARLKKLKNAPNLMKLLIHRDKDKANKNSRVNKHKRLKPKKPVKLKKRIVRKTRMRKVERRGQRIQNAIKRKSQKNKNNKRRRRSVVDNNEHEETLSEEINKYQDNNILLNRIKRSESEQDKINKIFDMNGMEEMTGTIDNMTDVFYDHLLETHRHALDKAVEVATSKCESINDLDELRNKTLEIDLYRTFIFEYKQIMEEWYLNMIFDLPSTYRKIAKTKIFKLSKDKIPSIKQINKYFEYDQTLSLRFELVEKTIRSAMKHMYDAMEDKVFAFLYGNEDINELLEKEVPVKNKMGNEELLNLLRKSTPGTTKGVVINDIKWK